jgi:hypothetical protein
VAGRRTSIEKLAGLVGKDCIVQTGQNGVVLRQLRMGSRPGVYTLVCTNPDTSVVEKVLCDEDVFSAAEVIWSRRRGDK